MTAKTRIAALAVLGIAATAGAEEGNSWMDGFFDQTNHTPKVLLDVRARYEYGDQENLDNANAATIRARVGLESQEYNGFSGLVEFEATRAADTTSYNAGDVHGDPNATVIADPESTELNRISLQYKKADNLAILGRQRIILDNARFIGNVGWRQNEQTYDALGYKNTMLDGWSFYYGYLDRVNRIYGSDASNDFESDSHLLNVGYTGLENHAFAAYAYLLDFENSLLNSSDTIGANYTFTGAVAEDYDLKGYAEFAYQQDGGDNPADYTAMYLHLNASVAREGYSGFIGYEILGSDDGIGSFRTPLATGHKFNGWNDQFLTTPIIGLHDFYAGIGVPVPKVPMKLIYHYFTSDEGSFTFGHEVDYVASYKLAKQTKLTAKASYYASANETVHADTAFDRFRFSIQIDYKY